MANEAVPGLLVFALRTFDYGPLSLDRLQIFKLVGAVNDEKLLRLGYIEKVPEHPGAQPQCGTCGVKFMDDRALAHHGDRRHPDVPRTETEEEALDETIAEREDQVAPLRLDRTAATLASAGPVPETVGRHRGFRTPGRSRR